MMSKQIQKGEMHMGKVKIKRIDYRQIGNGETLFGQLVQNIVYSARGRGRTRRL